MLPRPRWRPEGLSASLDLTRPMKRVARVSLLEGQRSLMRGSETLCESCVTRPCAGGVLDQRLSVSGASTPMGARLGPSPPRRPSTARLSAAACSRTCSDITQQEVVAAVALTELAGAVTAEQRIVSGPKSQPVEVTGAHEQPVCALTATPLPTHSANGCRLMTVPGRTVVHGKLLCRCTEPHPMTAVQSGCLMRVLGLGMPAMLATALRMTGCRPHDCLTLSICARCHGIWEALLPEVALVALLATRFFLTAMPAGPASGGAASVCWIELAEQLSGRL